MYTNHDYEPYAIDRDEEVRKILNKADVSFHTYKDHVIFEKREIVKDDDSLLCGIYSPTVKSGGLN